MPRGKTVTEDEYITIKRLLKNGAHVSDIAKVTCRGECTVYRIIRTNTYDEYVRGDWRKPKIKDVDRENTIYNTIHNANENFETETVEEVTPLYEVRESTIRRIADAVDLTNELLAKLIKIWEV